MAVAVTRDWTDGDGNAGTKLYVWCPGCDMLHGPEVGASNPAKRWDWNGSVEVPTLSPSLLVHGFKRCHSYLRAGRWEFLSDCEHHLAGQTVAMVEIPPGWF